jgi:lysophospholipase L1-like esterase
MNMLRVAHWHMDQFVPKGATVFLGDSLTMFLATAAITPFGINYGVGGQRSDQLVRDMDIYESVKRAGTVVIAIGTNDILQSQEEGIGSRYKAILEKIPPNVPVVMSSVPPMKEVWRRGRKLEDSIVRNVVTSAKEACKSDPRCVFVDAYDALTRDGARLADVLEKDGVHLAPLGYERWIRELRLAVSRAHAGALS